MPAPSQHLLYDHQPSSDQPDLTEWDSSENMQNGARNNAGHNRAEPKKGLTWLDRVCRLMVGFLLVVLLLLLGGLFGYFLLFQYFDHCASADSPGPSHTELSFEDEIGQACGYVYPWKSIRLPRSIVPTRYRLFLHPNLTELTHESAVDIDMDVVEEAEVLVLSQVALNHTTYSIYADGQKISARLAICDKLQQWAFLPTMRLRPGQKVQLHIEFVGEITRNFMAGIYVNSDRDHITGKERISAVTQFEPTHARRAFPCFDEPDFKAVFEVSIVREVGHVCRANTHLVHTESYGDHLEVDKFAPTLRMSTYILAFAVLNGFEQARLTTTGTRHPVEVSLWADVAHLEQQAQFGLETTVNALGFFETYFDIPFPMIKTDLLALDDFAEGAMENWGLITFRDVILLYDEKKSTEKNKEMTALVICHEVAHQWFGNYVTMRWWNDLWLNEGFANFMEFICVDRLYPDWDIMTNFFLDNHVYSTQMDGFDTSHAVSTEVRDPSQISSIFDAISYSKGSMILKMVAGLVGEAGFQKALQKYLKAFAYKNADGIDLWNVIQQSRFLYLEEARHPNTTEKWAIPVMYRSSAIKIPRMAWMFDNTEVISLGTVRSKWVVANADANGFYRVLYTEQIYKEFARQLEMTIIDRACIINDAFAFLKAGYLNVDVVLDLISYVQEGLELDRVPWVVIIQNLRSIENLLTDEPDLLALFEHWERTLVHRAYERIGWTAPPTHSARLLQPEMLHMVCRLRLTNCTAEAVPRFYSWLQDSTSIPVDLQSVVLEAGIRQGLAEDWDRLLQLYFSSKLPSEKNAILLALTTTPDVGNVRRLLHMCLRPKKIKTNVLPRVIWALMQNRAAASSVWHFVRQNRKKLGEILGDTSPMLGSMLKMVIENFSTEFDMQDVLETFGRQEMGASSARFGQAMESVKLNIQWRRLNQRHLRLWLEAWQRAQA